MTKLERIFSKRRAISRPFFSPASVTTMKCAERISSQGEGGALPARERAQKTNASKARYSGMERTRSIGPPEGGEASRKCYHGEQARCSGSVAALRGRTN